MKPSKTTKTETSILAIVTVAYSSGRSYEVRRKASRMIHAVDEDSVRDLRGVQFVRDVRRAFDLATSTPVWSDVADPTCVDELDAAGMLTYLAVAELTSQLGAKRAAKALRQVARDLRRYDPDDVRETVLNLVDEQR